jgi:CHAD domain-containing protein
MDDSSTQPRPSSLPNDPPMIEAALDAVSDEPGAGSTPSSSEPGEKRPRPSDPMITFAYDCLRQEFASLIERRPEPGQTPSPDDVHQTRIAMRRLRVALRLFRRMLPHEALDVRAELRAFARALGAIRDVDVHADYFREYADAIPAEHAGELGGYELHLRRERAEAKSRLAALYSDQRFSTLLASIEVMLDNAPSPGALRRWRSFKVTDGVDKYLRKSLRRVLKLGRKIGTHAHAKDLHRLRIRAKRCRYELEFFVAAYPSLKKAASEGKALQDLLGEHQDACNAVDRLGAYRRELRKRSGEPMPAALARLVETERQKARDVRGSFAAGWDRFERALARGRLAA